MTQPTTQRIGEGIETHKYTIRTIEKQIRERKITNKGQTEARNGSKRRKIDKQEIQTKNRYEILKDQMEDEYEEYETEPPKDWEIYI